MKNISPARAHLLTEGVDLAGRKDSTRDGKYEVVFHGDVHDERWSLSALDKQIARRLEDAKFVPDRATRLDWRSLARLNYSSAGRQKAGDEVEHLTFIRAEVARQIEQRREPLVVDRNQASELVDVLENAYSREQKARERVGELMPEPRYERYQINSLETSAEVLRDPSLLREVHEWEKSAGRNDPETSWEGRAVAREIMSEIAVEETKGRLQHFLESKRVASLNLGDHRTGSLREVEPRTLTDYLARAIESRQQRDHRHSIHSAARAHHGRLASDFEKAQDYYATAREFASEAHGSNPQFTDKEKTNLEIYAERLVDPQEREEYLHLAHDNGHPREQGIGVSLSR